MLARDSRARVALTLWLVVAGCATGDGGAGQGSVCGPGTVNQDGFCVPADRGGGDGDTGGNATGASGGAGGAQDADPGADPGGGGGDPAVADGCGTCNTDEDCTARCAGTHCARVDGQRLCVAVDDAVPPPAVDDAACADPCDLWAQCGCGAGEGCAIDDSGALGCEAVGVARQGQSCAGAPCAAGYFCLSDDTCAAYCDAEHDCPAGSACIMELQDWDGNPIATLCYGLAGCDLLAPDCPAGESCALVDGDPGTDCVTPGDVPVDGVCTYADDCVAGSSCVQFNDEASAHCRPHCDVADNGPCPAGRDCFDLDAGGGGVCAP